MESKIKIFENKNIRTAWNDDEEDWYFSVIDIISILIDSKDYQSARNYWKVLKKRLILEGNEPVTKCNRADRLDEIADPEKAIIRGADFYRAKGYTENWINQRLQTIEMRKELTDEWKTREIEKEKDYAILTNEMTKAWSGLSVKEYKGLKGLKKENLRDNMTNLELVLNMLAEVTTTAISKSKEPETFNESLSIAKEGGNVAKNARNDIESRIGKTIISPLNAKDKMSLEIKQIDQK